MHSLIFYIFYIPSDFILRSTVLSFQIFFYLTSLETLVIVDEYSSLLRYVVMEIRKKLIDALEESVASIFRGLILLRY